MLRNDAGRMADDDGLRTSGGQRVTWDQIREVDKSRWQTKGIAFVNARWGRRELYGRARPPEPA